MEEDKKIIHCWDEQEQRFFICGDENDSVWQRKVKAHEEFLNEVSDSIQWVIPTGKINNDGKLNN